MFEGRKRALVEDAREKGFVGSDETSERVMLGQTLFSPIWFLLIAPVFMILLTQQRAIVATGKNIYVLRLNFWRSKQVDSVEFTEPLAEASVRATTFGIDIEGTDKTYALLGQAAPMKEIAALAEQAKSARAEAGSAAGAAEAPTAKPPPS